MAPAPTALLYAPPQPFTCAQHSIGLAAAARSESNPSDRIDVLAAPASSQHCQSTQCMQPGEVQPPRTQHDSRLRTVPGKVPAVDTTIALPANADIISAGRGDVEKASCGRSLKNMAQPVVLAAQSMATQAAHSPSGQMPCRGHGRPQGDHAPTGSSTTRTPLAVPQPGATVARLLRGTPQHEPPEGIPGGDPPHAGAPDRKKQHSKKGRQAVDGSDALNPSAGRAGPGAFTSACCNIAGRSRRRSGQVCHMLDSEPADTTNSRIPCRNCV